MTAIKPNSMKRRKCDDFDLSLQILIFKDCRLLDQQKGHLFLRKSVVILFISVKIIIMSIKRRCRWQPIVSAQYKYPKFYAFKLDQNSNGQSLSNTV